ncbi:ATP-binding protein [Streptomyces sp. CC224B]|uniref:ATP-binding protein n=1 Tax=Streptomyces sp. CC224B TaxID=3044571 RepID=UPI0024A7D28D|nr:ATP-binding protein [Streptomyces sp. CC224B]
MDGLTYWFRHAAEPKAVPLGRRFVKLVLNDWGLEYLTEPVTLIASELLTNAVQATGTKLELSGQEREVLPFVAVRLRVSDVALVVEVYDVSRALPRIGTAAPDAEGGRGLPLVEWFSVRWQAYRHPSGGQGGVRGAAPRAAAGDRDRGAGRADPGTATDRNAGAAADPGPRVVREETLSPAGCRATEST